MVFSKRDTQIAKGVAILLLLCYHCFSDESRLYGYSVSFAPFSQKLGFSVFWAAYVCVGMFVFLSAFGLTRILKAQKPSLRFSPLEQLQFTTKRLFSLISPFLFTAAICIAVDYAIRGNWVFGTGAEGLLNLFAELFGVSKLLGTPYVCATWWFIGLMWIMLLSFPLIIELYRKFGALVLPIFVILPMLISFEGNAWSIMRWLIVAPFGIFFADYNLLERWKAKQLATSPVVSTLLKLLIMIPLTIAVGAVFQSHWGRAYLAALLSPLFSVIMVADVYLFLTDIPVLNQILAFLGKHSAYIFYIHTMIRHHWLRELTYSFGHWLLIALFLLVCSIACSYVVQLLQRLLRWDRLSAFLCGKLLQLEETLLPDRESVG